MVNLKRPLTPCRLMASECWSRLEGLRTRAPSAPRRAQRLPQRLRHHPRRRAGDRWTVGIYRQPYSARNRFSSRRRKRRPSGHRSVRPQYQRRYSSAGKQRYRRFSEYDATRLTEAPARRLRLRDAGGAGHCKPARQQRAWSSNRVASGNTTPIRAIRVSCWR